MSDFTLRHARETDMGDILFNWTTAFGDCVEFARSIITDCGLMDTALVAEMDGKAVSCIFAFDGLKLGGKTVSYLYALCTRGDYEGRGCGSALSRCAAEEAFSRGAEAVVLQPADEGLEKWYEKLGFSKLYATSDELIAIHEYPEKAVRELSGREYLALRGGESRLPENLLRAQETIFRYCGGGFLQLGEALLCVESDGYSLLIREANCEGGMLLLAAAAAACHFGMLSVWRRGLCSGEGDSCLMYRSSDGRELKLNEGEFLPFTLS